MWLSSRFWWLHNGSILRLSIECLGQFSGWSLLDSRSPLGKKPRKLQRRDFWMDWMWNRDETYIITEYYVIHLNVYWHCVTYVSANVSLSICWVAPLTLLKWSNRFKQFLFSRPRQVGFHESHHAWGPPSVPWQDEGNRYEARRTWDKHVLNMSYSKLLGLWLFG